MLTAPEYSAMYDLELANSAHQLQSVSLTLGSKPIYTYEWNERKKESMQLLDIGFPLLLMERIKARI